MRRRTNAARGRGGGESKIKGAGARERYGPCLHIFSAGAAPDKCGAAESRQALEGARPSPAPPSAGVRDSKLLERVETLR